MQVLEGGKDNPSFDGQPMFRKLNGEYVPKKEFVVPDAPEEASEEMKAKLNKVNEVLKILHEMDATFVLTMAVHNEDRKENEPESVGIVRWSGATYDIGFIFFKLMDEMHNSKLVHKISGVE